MFIIFFINLAIISYGGSRKRLAYPTATNNHFESLNRPSRCQHVQNTAITPVHTLLKSTARVSQHTFRHENTRRQNSTSYSLRLFARFDVRHDGPPDLASPFFSYFTLLPYAATLALCDLISNHTSTVWTSCSFPSPLFLFPSYSHYLSPNSSLLYCSTAKDLKAEAKSLMLALAS